MVTPNRYAIELRDKDGNLKARLEPYITSLNWEWNRIGGCGRCTFVISGDFLQFDIESDDDLRIYLPDEGANTATLWYRGYVESATPNLSGNESINVECSGYSGWLDRVIVHDSGDEKLYYGTEVSSIVDDIIDTFVVPQSSITRGTTDTSNVSPDFISFKGTAKETLRTLFDLLGDVEYGVDEDLVFFWRTQTNDFAHRFYVGGNVTNYKKRTDYKGIVNKVYFEGGDVSGSAFKVTGESTNSQAKYGLRESIISNGSINTSSAASQYIKGILKQKAIPQRQYSVKLENINKRIEATQPMGAIAVIDADEYQDGVLYGTTGNGGSNVLYGKIVNGGSGKKYGTTARNQIDRIQYNMSPMDGRVDADIQFGNSLSVSRASATINRLELNLNAVRQRSL